VAFATKVLVLSGFRITEFLGLKPGNIRGDWVHLDPGTTKNDEGRSVYIGDLSGELSARVRSGLPSYTRIAKALSESSAALAIRPKVTPHVLRHTTATRLTTKGVSLATVGKLMGHRSLNTTIKYAHIEDQALVAAVKLLMD
jgi:site-specific recombinase XerD